MALMLMTMMMTVIAMIDNNQRGDVIAVMTKSGVEYDTFLLTTTTTRGRTLRRRKRKVAFFLFDGATAHLHVFLVSLVPPSPLWAGPPSVARFIFMFFQNYQFLHFLILRFILFVSSHLFVPCPSSQRPFSFFFCLMVHFYLLALPFSPGIPS